MLVGFHHITLRVANLDRSRAFYSGLPGFDLDQDFPDLGKLRYRIGQTRARLVLCAPLPGSTGFAFDEHEIGLDHVAVGSPVVPQPSTNSNRVCVRSVQ